MNRIEKEKITVETMIRIYCKHKEKNTELCDDCKKLIEYAHARLDRCKFSDKKKACKYCVCHCYSPAMRDKIRSVMRYSGPMMLFYEPKELLKHILHM